MDKHHWTVTYDKYPQKETDPVLLVINDGLKMSEKDFIQVMKSKQTSLGAMVFILVYSLPMSTN